MYFSVIIKAGEEMTINYTNYRYPTLEKMDSYPEYGDKNYAGYYSFSLRRHRATERKVTTNDKIKAGIGALAGTIIPMLYLMKKQKIKNPLKLKYKLNDMVLLSGTSVIGGVCTGMIGENKKTKQNKVKEGIFQFLNAAVPTWIVGGVLKLCEGSKNFNNIPGKMLSIAGGLLVGMYGAASISNLIYVMRILLSETFKKEVKVRLRPGFFPFTEPSFELDCSCLICGGKGCPTCKNSGWLEFCGCGMIHPNVVKESGIDPEEYTGFAFGFGITRIAMMKYKIGDIRVLNSGDVRALKEFEIE